VPKIRRADVNDASCKQLVLKYRLQRKLFFFSTSACTVALTVQLTCTVYFWQRVLIFFHPDCYYTILRAVVSEIDTWRKDRHHSLSNYMSRLAPPIKLVASLATGGAHKHTYLNMQSIQNSAFSTCFSLHFLNRIE
jgi:hypothetical protein